MKYALDLSAVRRSFAHIINAQAFSALKYGYQQHCQAK